MNTNIDIAILESAGSLERRFFSRLVLNCKMQNFQKYYNKKIKNITLGLDFWILIC